MRTFALGGVTALCLLLAVGASAQPAPVVATSIFNVGQTTLYYMMTEDGWLYSNTQQGVNNDNPAGSFDFFAGTGVTAPVGPLAHRVYEYAATHHIVMLVNGDVYTLQAGLGRGASYVGNFWTGTSIVPTPEMLDGFQVTYITTSRQYHMLLPNGELYVRGGTNSWALPPDYAGNFFIGPPVPTKSATFGTLKGDYKGKD